MNAAECLLGMNAGEARLLTAALDAAFDGVALVGMDLKYVYVNPALCEMTRCESPAQMIGREVRDFLSDDMRSRLQGHLEAVLSDRRVRFEGMQLAATGELVPVEAGVSVLRDEDGQPRLLLAIVRDVSDRKRAEEALRESREKLVAIFENVGVGISLISPRMEILELNRTMRKWFPDADVSRKPLCFQTFNDPPRDEPCSYCPTIKTLRDGQVYEAVTETPAGDGILNYRIVSTPVTDAAGRVVAAIEMVEEVTERKRAEDAIRSADEYKAKILATSMDGFLVMGPDGGIREVNDAFCRMVGYTRAELLRLNVRDLNVVHTREQVSRHIEDVVRQGGDRFETTHRRKDGGTVDLEVSTSCVERDGEPQFVAFIRDITQRKRAEQALQAKNSELESFVYTVSHDLRAPLVSLEGFSKLLADEHSDRLDSEGLDYLERLRSNVAAMDSLLNDLLQLSRVGRVDEAPSAVSAGEVVVEALDNLSGMIGDSGAEVRVARGLPTVAYSRARLIQLFTNLISNAVKFSRDGEAPRVEIGSERVAQGYRFFVKDNGIGIPAGQAQKVFEIFSRLKQKDVEGTGIGLAIVKRIVETHGGQVGVDSAPGQGSTFWFTVPDGNFG